MITYLVRAPTSIISNTSTLVALKVKLRNQILTKHFPDADTRNWNILFLWRMYLLSLIIDFPPFLNPHKMNTIHFFPSKTFFVSFELFFKYWNLHIVTLWKWNFLTNHLNVTKLMFQMSLYFPIINQRTEEQKVCHHHPCRTAYMCVCMDGMNQLFF